MKSFCFHKCTKTKCIVWFFDFKFGIITRRILSKPFSSIDTFPSNGTQNTLIGARKKQQQNHIQFNQIDREKTNISLISMIAYGVPLQNVGNYTATEHTALLISSQCIHNVLNGLSLTYQKKSTKCLSECFQFCFLICFKYGGHNRCREMAAIGAQTTQQIAQNQSVKLQLNIQSNTLQISG